MRVDWQKLKADEIKAWIEPIPTWRATLQTCGMVMFGFGFGVWVALTGEEVPPMWILATFIIGLALFVIGSIEITITRTLRTPGSKWITFTFGLKI